MDINLDILFYNNIDSLYESWEMRVVTALMANKATSRERAINPNTLPTSYVKNIDDVILKGYAKSVNGEIYLTMRGCLVANHGMQKLVANDIWPPRE